MNAPPVRGALLAVIAALCGVGGCQSHPGGTMDPFLRQRIPPPGTGAAPLSASPYPPADAAPRFEGRGATPVDPGRTYPGTDSDGNYWPDENSGAARRTRNELKPGANEVVRIKEPPPNAAAAKSAPPAKATNADAGRVAARTGASNVRPTASRRGDVEPIDIMDLPAAGAQSRDKSNAARGAGSRRVPLKARPK